MSPALADFPSIETERLVIRPLSTSDIEAVTALTDDPAITNVVHFLPSPFTRPDAEALLGRHDDENCFLGAFHQGELIGVVGTHARGEDQLEIGYWIGSAFQRRGYASEAVCGVIARLRDLYPGWQIAAECRIGNDPSWALLHKLGFCATGQPGKRPGRALLVLR